MHEIIVCECGTQFDIGAAPPEEPPRCPNCGQYFDDAGKPLFFPPIPVQKSASAGPVNWDVISARTAAGLIAFSVLASILRSWVAAFSGDDNAPIILGRYQQEDAFSAETIFAAILGLGLGFIIIMGLLKQKTWAKWLMLVVVAINAVALLWIAQLPSRSLPGIGGWPLYLIAPGLVIAWFLLLDRPATERKVFVGASGVILFQVASLVYGLSMPAH